MVEVIGWLDEYAWGAFVILRVFVVAALLTVVLGLIGAAARLAGMYVTFFRGTPELLVLLLFYFGAAVTLTSIARVFDASARFVDIPPFWAGSLALALIAGAYATESFRGAFLGVERGQIDAARSLGLRPVTTFRTVVWPQALRLALPPYGNEVVGMLKTTALASTVTMAEITGVAETIVAETFAPYEVFLSAAIIYLVLVWIFERGLAVVERSLETP